jgi:hypothetical protein
MISMGTGMSNSINMMGDGGNGEGRVVGWKTDAVKGKQNGGGRSGVRGSQSRVECGETAMRKAIT